MKNVKFHVAMAFVCIVLGFMLSIQFKTVRYSIGPVSEYRARELASQVKNLKEENDALMKEKNEKEDLIRQYEETASKGSYSAKMLKEELDNARTMAGIEDVEGPGVTVVIDDLEFSQKVNYPIISYTDLLEILNELNSAGAEAVSINGQRVISSTEIRQAGIYININTVRFSPPFIFRAIGEPKTLEGALLMREGIVENIQERNVVVTVNPEQNIVIPKFNGIIERKYARVVKEGEGR